MNTIRKSTLAALFAAAAFAPLASLSAGAAEFYTQDNAAMPTPFSGGDRTPTVRAPLGAPQFVTQEQIATTTTGVAYGRVNGQWVRVDAGR